MSLIEAVIIKNHNDVNARLKELELDRETLLKIRDMALNEAANTTPFHAINAHGTFSYHQGIFALRINYVKPNTNWRIDRSNGIEGIVNDKLRVRVAFSNVDIACNDYQKPKPRSRKGAGSEIACSGNLFEVGALPEYAPMQAGKITYYLMVSEDGAVELTKPIVRGHTFTAWPERIYLSNGDDFNSTPISLDDSDVVDDFDPQVVRK